MTNKGFSARDTLRGKIERLFVLIGCAVVFFAAFPFFSEKLALLFNPNYHAVNMKVLSCDVDVVKKGKYTTHEMACTYEYLWEGIIHQATSESLNTSMKSLFRKSITDAEFSKIMNEQNLTGYVDTNNPFRSFLRIESLWLTIKLIFLGLLTFLPILVIMICGILAFEVWRETKKLKVLLTWLTIAVIFFPFMFWWFDFAYDPQSYLTIYSKKFAIF